VLSRTKNSLQLHFNQGEGEEEISSEDDEVEAPLDSKVL